MRIAAIIVGGSVITAIALTVFTAFTSPQAAGAPVSPPQPSPKSIIMLAKPQHPVPTAARISEWIRDLLGANPAAQEIAEERLIAAGDAAVPELSKTLNQPLITRTGTKARTALEAIQRADIQRGPLVTLRVSKMLVKQIITKLCRQVDIGAKFNMSLDRDHQSLSMDVRRQPFWKVLQRIAAVSGVSPTATDDGEAIPSLYFGRHGLFVNGTRVFADGGMAIAVESLSVVQTRTFGEMQWGFPDRYSCLNFVVLWYPSKSQWLYSLAVKLSQAEDDHGKSLLGKAYENQWGPACYAPRPTIICSFPIDLKWPPSQAKAIRILRGDVSVMLSSGVRTYEVANLRSGHAALKVAGMYLKFGTPTIGAGRWNISLYIRAPISSIEDQVFVNQLFSHGELILRTANGRKLTLSGGSVGGYGRDHKYDLWVYGGTPASAWIKIHGRLVHLKFPFRFRNVPIPQ